VAYLIGHPVYGASCVAKVGAHLTDEKHVVVSCLLGRAFPHRVTWLLPGQWLWITKTLSFLSR